MTDIYHPYLDNKYSRWYDSIIYNAQCAERKRSKDGPYYENHHIHPKCFIKNERVSNKVLLTAREHFICHWLLTKMMVTQRSRRKTLRAMNAFLLENEYQNRTITARRFEIARKLASEAKRGVPSGNAGRTMSEEAKEKRRQTLLQRYGTTSTPGFTGGKHTAEHRKKMTLIMTGNQHTKDYKHSEETKEKISKGTKGKPKSEEMKANLSRSIKGRPAPWARKPMSEAAKEKLRETRRKKNATTL